MKITVLSENTADKKLRAEWGLSYLVENAGETMLFDTGSSNLFLENAAKMDLNPDGVDKVVLSHGHWDHGTGLQYLSPGKQLYCHPGSFIERFNGKRSIGLPMPFEEIAEKFDLKTSKSPVEIIPDVWFLGEVPRENDFESRETPFSKKDGSPDFVVDDSALAVKMDRGIGIISGCAHAGICNTIEHAKKVLNDDRVVFVIGGFHLTGGDEKTTKTVEYMKTLRAETIRPSHCTQFPALTEFYAAFGGQPLKVGQVLDFGVQAKPVREKKSTLVTNEEGDEISIEYPDEIYMEAFTPMIERLEKEKPELMEGALKLFEIMGPEDFTRYFNHLIDIKKSGPRMMLITKNVQQKTMIEKLYYEDYCRAFEVTRMHVISY